MVFQARKGSHIRGNAQAIGEELERIRAASGGFLTPNRIVREAKPEDSALHKEFEWDDLEAAQKYREGQARVVVKSIVTVTPVSDTDPQTTPAPAFIHVKVRTVDEDGNDGEMLSAYCGIRDVLNDEDMRSQMLRDAMRELHSFTQKYKDLAELSSVFDAIGSIA